MRIYLFVILCINKLSYSIQWMDYITQYIIEHDIDLLTITETWLTETNQDIN